MSLIYPLFAMFLLTAVVLVKMFITRMSAVKTGQIKMGYFKTYEGHVPEAVITTARHFSNLFEAPVLFYVICTLGLVTAIQSEAFVILAWGYVLARTVHAYVHTGANKLRLRMLSYGAGWLIMVAMWIILLMKATV